MGVTGTRDQVGGAAQRLVARARAAAPDFPVCVGLGVSNAEQAAEGASFADGVIVARRSCAGCSTIPTPPGVSAVRELATELADGVRRTG